MSIRLIRRKIRAVGNIKKITKAMEMVAASKLKKVQGRLLAIRPYAGKIRELLEGLSGRVAPIGHPLFQVRDPAKAVALVTLSSDKGLCGSYNANILRAAARFAAEQTGPVRHLLLGRKGVDFFSRRGADIRARHIGLPVDLPFARVRVMARELIRMFETGDVDAVFVAYTEFVNAVTFRPRLFRFLPIRPEGAGTAAGVPKEAVPYIFEPDPAGILDQLAPRYVEVAFQRILLEAMASEYAARMSAMRNATESAEELIDHLTLTYNKARQSSITKELLDIVGGAEALK